MGPTSWPQRILRWLDGRSRRAHLSTQEESDTFLSGGRPWGRAEFERPAYDRRALLEQALEAWRVNPLARRLVGLTTQYVVGGGVGVSSPQAAAHDFLGRFWEHPLNRMAVRLVEWCDELTRSGNLFILLTSDSGGMTYARAVPALQVERIESAANDVEQELYFYPHPSLEEPQPAPWKGLAAPGSPLEPRMLHFAINRPAGAVWGESDLAPALKWLARYAAWLEDRARLNRFRNAFLFVVKSRFTGEAERAARQRQLNGCPPTPGSIIVTDEGEEWTVINPQLEAADAATDGLALKKMIAAGAGVPLHFLAEPESSTRTTAEAAGGPTFRHFEQRQRFFLQAVQAVLRQVLERRACLDPGLDPAAEIQVRGADISARDNLELSEAARNILPVLVETRQRGLIDDAEFLRLVYRFCGEA